MNFSGKIQRPESFEGFFKKGKYSMRLDALEYKGFQSRNSAKFHWKEKTFAQ